MCFLPADLFELQVKTRMFWKSQNLWIILKILNSWVFYTCFEVLDRALSRYQLKIIEAWHISCKKTMKQISRALWHQFCVSVSIIRGNFLFLSFVVLLPCISGSFPHFFTSLLPTGLSRRPHVIEWLWFPYIYFRYLYMYLSGVTDKLSAKELR